MERSETNRVSVADQGAPILRRRILNGELFPGTQLPEVPMATSLGVSRNTLHEANCILDRSQPQRSGKIDSRNQENVTIGWLQQAEACADRLAQHFRMTPKPG
jgi:DNA-binding FadR family transcriptional regulator